MADDIQQTIESLKALTQNIPEDAEGRRARFRMLQAAGQAVRGMGDRVPQELRDSLYSVLGETEVMLRESELNEERDRNADIEAEARAQLRQRGESGAVVTDRETGALVGVDTGTPIQTPTYAQQPSFMQFEAPPPAEPRTTADGRPLPPGSPMASPANFPQGQATPLTESGDPRGTVDAQTVAGTPRARRGTTSTPVAPSEPGKPGKLDPYDPYNIQEMYDQTGPFTQIRDSFTREGEIKSEAGLQSASDIMAAAEEMKALRSQAFQRMGEDLVAQEQRLRELDLQLSTLREMRFDSDRLFRNRGHGVSLALGMAVGAMQQTISNILYPGANVPNTAMQLVQDAIDRDLREQAVNYQRAQTEIGMGRTAYEMARQMGMDHTAAYEYARAGAQEYVASQLQATRMRMGAGVAAEQMHRAEQELRLQAMDRKNMALMAMAQMQAPRVAGRGGVAGRTGHVIAPMLMLREGVTVKQAQDAIGTTTYNKLIDTMRGAADVLRLVDRIRSLSQQNPGFNFGTQTRGELQSLAGQLVNAIRTASQMGALDNGSLALAEKIAGDPTAITETMPTFLGRLGGLRSNTVAIADDYANRIGQRLLRFDETERAELAPTPPGLEFTDEEQPPSGRQGRLATVAEALRPVPTDVPAGSTGGGTILE